MECNLLLWLETSLSFIWKILTVKLTLKIVRSLLLIIGLLLFTQVILLLILDSSKNRSVSQGGSGQENPSANRNAVSGSSQECLQEAVIEQDLDILVKQIEGQEKWEWIVARLKQTWPHWIDTAQLMKNQGKLLPRQKKRILVVPGLLMVTDFAGKASVGAGGPLGDLVQWADLIAALHVLGHNITLMTDIYQATRGLRYGQFLWSPLPQCAVSGFNHVFTDIMTLKAFPHHVIAPESINCQFRVIDAYGTEAMYNHPEYSLKSGFVSATYGGLGLDLRQFFTFYPHTPENTFLGFAVHSPVLNNSHTFDRDPRMALVYGKNPGYFKSRKPYLQTLKDLGLSLHTTLQNSSGLTPGLVNHGVLSSQQYAALMRKAKYFIGLGEPLESTGVIEALSQGCIFINPRFTGNQSLILQAMGKPTSRKMSSQVPYLEGKPQVVTIDISNITSVKIAIEQASVLQNKPSLPEEFTSAAFLSRLDQVITNLDLCGSEVDPWPALNQMHPILSSPTETCSEACQRRDMTCEYSFFRHINAYVHIEGEGVLCSQKDDLPGLLYPAFLPYKQTCIIQKDLRLFSCAGGHENVRRLCPCRVDLPV